MTMTRDQVVELLQLIRAHDNRTVDEIAIQVFTHAAIRAHWTHEAAREAVLDHFTTTVGEWLMPGHITQHIKASYVKALSELPEDRRQLMNNIHHALQGMGFPTRRARDTSRAIALRRQPQPPLTTKEETELRQHLAIRAELDARPATFAVGIGNLVAKLANQKAIEAAS
ncbi:hypothetical protein ACFO5K_04060 [Nocardia halotolerans]|uniref:DUF222 domain-containing protein n=1 Tax=Nocardia halotolerans TaxID=1755878 RepID=A0ABV8VD60_9NOCA